MHLQGRTELLQWLEQFSGCAAYVQVKGSMQNAGLRIGSGSEVASVIAALTALRDVLLLNNKQVCMLTSWHLHMQPRVNTPAQGCKQRSCFCARIMGIRALHVRLALRPDE